MLFISKFFDSSSDLKSDYHSTVITSKKKIPWAVHFLCAAFLLVYDWLDLLTLCSDSKRKF